MNYLNPDDITQNIPLELHVCAAKNNISIYGIDESERYRLQFSEIREVLRQVKWQDYLPGPHMQPKLKSTRHGIILATEKDEPLLILGAVLFYEEERNIHVSVLLKNSKYTFGRKGIGSILLSAILNAAARLNYKACTFDPINEAVEFYESLLNINIDTYDDPRVQIQLNAKNELHKNFNLYLSTKNTCGKYDLSPEFYFIELDYCKVLSVHTSYVVLRYIGNKFNNLLDIDLYVSNIKGTRSPGECIQNIKMVSYIDLNPPRMIREPWITTTALE